MDSGDKLFFLMTVPLIIAYEIKNTNYVLIPAGIGVVMFFIALMLKSQENKKYNSNDIDKSLREEK